MIRLLTIHSAKGLEFKVVVVADAGRDRGRPDADEILCLPDGRLGFRVADPGDRQAAADGRVRERQGGRAGRRGGRAAAALLRRHDARDRPADRLRARSASVGRTRARRSAGCSTGSRRASSRMPRPGRWRSSAAARGCSCGSTVSRRSPRSRRSRWPRTAARAVRGRRERRGRAGGTRARAARRGARAAAPPRAPALVQRALAVRALLVPLLRRAGRRPAPATRAGTVPGQTGPRRDRDRRRGARAARARRPARAGRAGRSRRARAAPATRPSPTRSSSGSAASSPSYCESELAARIAALEGATAELPFAFEHDGVLLHGRIDVLHRDGPRALVLDYKTNSLAEGTPEEIVEHDYRLQRLVYALACFRAGAEEVEVVYHFLERPDAVVSTTYRRRRRAGARGRAVGGDRADPGGRVPPDARRVRLPDCPALDLVCAGPKLLRLMARSYVREARRRVGPKRERIRPIIERLLAEHPDATIALTLPQRPRAARLGDALGADDRRERQPRHRAAVREVPHAARTTSRSRRRSSRTTSARPASSARRRSRCAGRWRCCSRSTTAQVPRRMDELLRLPGVARKTANVVVAERGEAAGDRRRHARAPALAAARPHAAGRPGQDRARPDAARAARALERLPAPADLARPPGLHRPHAALRGLRPERPLSCKSGRSRHRARHTRARRLERMRGVDLAIYADALAGEAASLAAAPSAARSRLRQAAIEKRRRRRS